MIDVNIRALTMITRSILPEMRRRNQLNLSGGSRIVFVSSIASAGPSPGTAVYAATKAYLTSLSQVIVSNQSS